MILLIDNYDSFTYNVVQYLSELGADVLVKRTTPYLYMGARGWAKHT